MVARTASSVCPRTVAASPLPRYERLASELAASIAASVFKPGERMPSVRKCALARRLSVPTVNEAYRLLEDRGLVESRPRSGYYVVRPSARANVCLPTSKGGGPIRVCGFEALCRAPISASVPGALPFGAAVPSAQFFPVRRLKSIMSGILRRHPLILGSYEFAPGLPELRRQIAKRGIAWGCQLDAERTVVTNGGVEAISLCLQAMTRPGDIVAVESPAYYGFLYLLEAQGLQALEISTDPENGLVVNALEAALEDHPVRACLISTTVSNPTGATMPDSEKRRLVSLLEAAKVPLIEDATFADLQRGGARHAAKAYDRTGNVMLCASLTKTIAPGLRLGWAEAGLHAERVAFLKRVSSTGQPALLQEILAEYLDCGGIERHLRGLRATFSNLIGRHMDAVARHFPPGTRVAQPSGGFLLWVVLPNGIDTQTLQLRALDIGLGLAPGPMFSATGGFPNALRINCGLEWSDGMEQSYRRYGALLAGRE